jgi:hypothetical protein
MKSDAAPCHFVSTSYADNSMEYWLWNYADNICVNKWNLSRYENTYSDVGKGVGLFVVSGVTVDIPSPGSYNKWTC